MDSQSSNEQTNAVARRDILRIGTAGFAAIGLSALAPLAQAVQGAATLSPSVAGQNDRDPRTVAHNAREWSQHLAQYGTLSLMGSKLALAKAQAPDVREFANFEFTEQTAVAHILHDMGVRTPALDAMSRPVLREHEQAQGEEFDRVYSRAQLVSHQKLLMLMESLLANSKSQAPMEREARHLATFATAAVKEHIVHSKALVAAHGG